MLTLILCAACCAPSPTTDLFDSLQFELRGGVWVPRLNGNASLGSMGTRFNLEQDLLLDSSETTPLVELHARWQRWSGMLSAFTFDTSGAGAFAETTFIEDFAVTAGTRVASNVEIDSGALQLKYALYRPFSDKPLPWSEAAPMAEPEEPCTHCLADLRLGPTFDVRYVDVEQSFEFGGQSVEGDGTWIGVLAGVDLTLDIATAGRVPLIDHFQIQGGAAGGPALGGDGGFMWQARAGVTIGFTPNFGVSLGYRLLELDVENDGFDFEGGLQGLFIGGSLRF
jgi:hypothetical protein